MLVRWWQVDPFKNRKQIRVVLGPEKKDEGVFFFSFESVCVSR